VHNGGMKKQTAIRALGGFDAAVARVLGISRQAVFKWPDPLPKSVETKVRKAIEQRKQKEQA